MRMYREKPPGTPPPPPRIERRSDSLTRAVVAGLEQMTADFEQMPEGTEKALALAAVARFSKRIAAALELRNRAGKAEVAKPADGHKA